MNTIRSYSSKTGAATIPTLPHKSVPAKTSTRFDLIEWTVPVKNREHAETLGAAIYANYPPYGYGTRVEFIDDDPTNLHIKVSRYPSCD